MYPLVINPDFIIDEFLLNLNNLFNLVSSKTDFIEFEISYSSFKNKYDNFTNNDLGRKKS